MKIKKHKQSNHVISENVNVNQNPEITLNLSSSEDNCEKPEIYKIVNKNKSINRKDFIKMSAAIGGLAVLNGLLQSCDEESSLDIEIDGKNCTCHVVCVCNTVVEGGDMSYKKGNSYISKYNQQGLCTCDTVCTCNSICSCDSVCSCDSHSESYYYSGGSYTYWYPN